MEATLVSFELHRESAYDIGTEQNSGCAGLSIRIFGMLQRGDIIFGCPI